MYQVSDIARIYTQTSIVCYSCFTCLVHVLLFLLSLFSCLLSLFVLLSQILQFSYLSCYLVSYICSCSCYYLCTLFICTSFPFTHTLTRSLSDDPGFAHPDIGRFGSIVQVFDETVRLARSWILPPFLFWYSCIFLFLLFSLIHVYHTQLPFHSLFYLRSCVALICIIAVIADYYGSDLQLVQVTLGLASIRGVFSSRIYVADSRRDSVSTYFGKRGVTLCNNTPGSLKTLFSLCQVIFGLYKAQFREIETESLTLVKLFN